VSFSGSYPYLKLISFLLSRDLIITLHTTKFKLVRKHKFVLSQRNDWNNFHLLVLLHTWLFCDFFVLLVRGCLCGWACIVVKEFWGDTPIEADCLTLSKSLLIGSWRLCILCSSPGSGMRGMENSTAEYWSLLVAVFEASLECITAMSTLKWRKQVWSAKTHYTDH